MNKSVGKKSLGLCAGVLSSIIIMNLRLDIPIEGQKCMALSIMAVIWWATKAMDAGLSSLALLVGYALFLDPKVVPLSTIFGLWSSPNMYLVIGGFLIAEAIKKSGLGERLAYVYIRKFVHSYRGVIISCYVLGFLLSFIIPHPWPRCFLLVSVMAHVVSASKLSEKFASQIGFAIFASSIPTAMILITGDSTLNSTVSNFSGTPLSWGSWLLYMGIPGIIASSLTCIAQIVTAGKPEIFQLDENAIKENQNRLGKLQKKEIKAIIIMVIVITLWMTDSVHGIHPGWIAALASICLGLPSVEILTKESWSAINISTLIFLSAALSIGAIGNITGMNDWIAGCLMPSSLSSNPYIFAIIACVISMIIHMILGSSLAVLGIAAPAIISMGSMVGIAPLVCAMITYTAVCLHWILPFHHMNLLIGIGDNGGNYTEKHVFKLGLIQTFIVLVICIFEIFWWSLIGLF